MVLCVVVLRFMFVVVIVRAVMNSQRMDNAAGSEEQQCFEERVRREVEETCNVTPGADSQHHKSQLANCRVGEHPLDVKPDDGDCGGDYCRDTPDVGNRQRGAGRQNGKHPRGQVDAGCDHRRRMDERTDGCRTLHGVGQPSVQRHLRRLADSPAKNENARYG